MQRWRGVNDAPAGWGRCVVTIGVFDGVHQGHRHIIGTAIEQARKLEIPSVVVTFDPHPSEVVRPGTHPARLTSLALKEQLLAELGVDVMCVLPFTLEFSRLAPKEFVHQVLVEHLHAAMVVVGENFRFGHKAAGDVATLRELGRTFGFETDAVSMVADDSAQFSSTYVRSCIAAGEVEAAATALGRSHRIEGIVVRGAGRGHDLGYPTANLHTEPYAAVPADGVYAGYATVRDRTFKTAISVGTNPTFDEQQRTVEAYLLDFDEDLYGHTIAVEFTHRLRGQERFDSIDELIVQMAKDVQRARDLLQ